MSSLSDLKAPAEDVSCMLATKLENVVPSLGQSGTKPETADESATPADVPQDPAATIPVNTSVETITQTLKAEQVLVVVKNTETVATNSMDSKDLSAPAEVFNSTHAAPDIPANDNAHTLVAESISDHGTVVEPIPAVEDSSKAYITIVDPAVLTPTASVTTLVAHEPETDKQEGSTQQNEQEEPQQLQPPASLLNQQENPEIRLQASVPISIPQPYRRQTKNEEGVITHPRSLPSLPTTTITPLSTSAFSSLNRENSNVQHNFSWAVTTAAGAPASFEASLPLSSLPIDIIQKRANQGGSLTTIITPHRSQPSQPQTTNSATATEVPSDSESGAMSRAVSDDEKVGEMEPRKILTKTRHRKKKRRSQSNLIMEPGFDSAPGSTTSLLTSVSD